jgi:hypothetical protein
MHAVIIVFFENISNKYNYIYWCRIIYVKNVGVIEEGCIAELLMHTAF